jgi:quercetin dioxygenase-like cupin family protein
MSVGRVVQPQAGAVMFGLAGDEYRTILSGAETGGTLLLVEMTVQPGGGPPLHRHRREDETFVVQSGRLSIWLGDRAVEAEAGATVWAPRGVAHTFKNRGDGPARVLLLITPAETEGPLPDGRGSVSGAEEFFAAITRPQRPTAAALLDPEIRELIPRLAPKYGIEILGPSPL